MTAMRTLRTALPVLAAAVICFSVHPARAADPPPYTVKGNKVDEHTYKGFLYYGDECFRCHGPGGAGSSYAPALTDSLKHLTK